MKKKALQVFEEIKKDIPNMCKNWGKNGKDGQLLYGDVLDWIRDTHSDIYCNERACALLARLIIGQYVIVGRLL